MPTQKGETRRRKTRVIIPQGTLLVDGQDPIAITRRFVVGRSEGSSLRTDGTHLFLPDPYVSHCHCTFDPTDAGIKLEDTRSENGTFVNEIRIFKAVLDKDCTIQLGNTRFEFRLGSPRIETVSDSFGDLIGHSRAMRDLFVNLQRAAANDDVVVLLGETGTGKELAAEAIHKLGPRKDKPFVIVDCTAIPHSLAEASLFGVCTGAFTGAVNTPGYFERADGGTIFLDEIGELGIDIQAKLLRVIENGTVQRVGGTDRRKVDVRILAATWRDLKAMVNEGKFRQDLYYRLGGIEVHLPPLREHTEDIPLLVSDFCRAIKEDSKAAAANAYVARRCANYPWLGNVRELRVIVETFARYGEESASRRLYPYQSPHSPEVARKASSSVDYANMRFADAKAELEREYLADLYQACKGNVAEMIRQSGMKRETITKKLREYQIRD